MKTKLISVALMLLSFATFGAKIMVTGEPVVLEKRGEMYFVPVNYSTNANYHYVAIDGTNRVCYLEKQPALTSLNTMMIDVNVGGTTASWVCYEYSPDYFDMAH